MADIFLKLEPVKGAAEYYAGTREDNKPCVWMKDTAGNCSIVQNAKSKGDARTKAIKWQVKENYAVLKSKTKNTKTMSKNATNTKTKIDPLIKKFGQPKFKDGDKVTTSITGKEVLTIDGDAWSNGFSWMYNFKEDKDKSIGQSYIINKL